MSAAGGGDGDGGSWRHVGGVLRGGLWPARLSRHPAPASFPLRRTRSGYPIFNRLIGCLLPALPYRRRASGVTSRVLGRWLAVGFAAALCCAPAAVRAQDAGGYSERVKAVLARVMAGREFKPGAGCDKMELCDQLIKQLRAGDFS